MCIRDRETLGHPLPPSRAPGRITPTDSRASGGIATIRPLESALGCRHDRTPQRPRLAARLRPRHRGDRSLDGRLPPRERLLRQGPVGPALPADHLARRELGGDGAGPPRRRARLLRLELFLLAALPHPCLL